MGALPLAVVSLLTPTVYTRYLANYWWEWRRPRLVNTPRSSSALGLTCGSVLCTVALGTKQYQTNEFCNDFAGEELWEPEITNESHFECSTITRAVGPNLFPLTRFIKLSFSFLFLFFYVPLFYFTKSMASLCSFFYPPP